MVVVAHDAVKFDVVEFSAQRIKLAFSYVWLPPQSDSVRVDYCIAWASTKCGRARLAMLDAWANSGDPDGSIRAAYAKKKWEEREAGVQLVVLS